MLEAYLYDGLRSPIGRHAGKLAPLRPDDLAAEVIRQVVARNQLQPGDISDVVLGCVNQAGEDNRNVARFAALLGGLPPTTPAARSTGFAQAACRRWSTPRAPSPAAKATSTSRAASRA